jgi:hypothetical protein
VSRDEKYAHYQWVLYDVIIFYVKFESEGLTSFGDSIKIRSAQILKTSSRRKNMFKRAAVLMLVSVFALVGCASQGGYQPTVDTYNNPNAKNLGRDMEECKALASKASGGGAAGTETLKGAAVGGLIGAAAGAAIGATVGAPGTGAAMGAAIGGIGGGAKEGLSAEDQYKSSYQKCLKNRGHNVVN